MADIHKSCKKAKAYAWAKYYESMREQANNAIIIVRQVPMRNENGVIKVESIPTHFTNEYIDMAKQLCKTFSCPICWEMVNGETIGITHCGHIYCDDCLATIKNKENPECAICRRKL